MPEEIKQKALDYHRQHPPGKITIAPTKALTTQSDLALAYSPGVAAACEAIVEDPDEALHVTARANLVAVISNGTAVLGLGNIGPLASKPVMEGKGVLFKKFAGVDVFDIEVNESDPEKLVDICAALEPTFGGINLEDIKAPECFFVEQALKDRVKIPVFHDDQHGTAIIAGAALVNALYIVGKDIGDIRIVTSGAGAAGMACLDLAVSLGVRRENITVTDRKGVVYRGREDLRDGDAKSRYAQDTQWRTLADAIDGADVFLGVSAPGILTRDMVQSMAPSPLILALANPIPEIMPAEAREAREDAIIATGRSDFPNQVNNVLCFPYIFRGALDVSATTINEEMKMACVHAIAELARIEASDVSAAAYGGDLPQFGPDYLIPQPFDPRLIAQVAPAVARAAMDTGVARRPIEDMDAYVEKLYQFVFRTGLLMKPLFQAAKSDPKRVVYAEGEEEVVLRAVQNVIDDGLASPILVARPSVLKMRIEKLGLRLDPEKDVKVINPESDPRYKDYWQLYHQKMRRRGVTPDIAKTVVRTRASIIAAIMVERGEADAMIAGVVGNHEKILERVINVLGLKPGVSAASSVSVLATEKQRVFVCDTHVNAHPSAEEIAEATILAAERVREFGMTPRVALVCHSDFGSHNDESAAKMRQALELIHQQAPDLEVEGEMKADTALEEHIRDLVFPDSGFNGAANLLVMPDQASAHIAYSMTRVVSGAVSVGPMINGLAKPAHVLTPTATVRRVVNMTAVAVVEAQK
ncbi:MAG: NADP-dependent malic enzyme [Xanthomonadales bacterium]|nr:NADP-dependent malic enzyme [Xanthomonadales bacterium]